VEERQKVAAAAVAIDAYIHDGVVLVAKTADTVVGHLQLIVLGDPLRAEVKNMAVS